MMGEFTLPKGWIKTNLANIVAINPKHKELENQTAGFVPMALAPMDFSKQLNFEERAWDEIKKGYTHFANGDVIFAKVTPCFENGKAAIVHNMPNGIGAGSTEFYALRPYVKELSQDYIFSIIKSHDFLTLGAENMTGAVGLRRVPKQFVESFSINLPPAAEQKIIAQKLDTLLAQVESTKARLERTREILKRFRQSVLAAAVSGKLTEEWRGHKSLDADLDLDNEISHSSDKERKSESTSSHEVVLNNFPSCWAKTTFSKIYRFIDYRGKTPTKSESGKRLYTAKNIKMGFISDSPVEYLSEEYFKSWMTRGFTKKGDILFVTEGHTMGCVALNEIGSDIGLAQRTLTLQPHGNVRTKFHLYYMMDVNFQKLVDLNATGSAAKGIKAAKFRGLPVPFPSYEEQTEIVRRVEQLFAHADTIEKQTEAALARVNNLTQSILAKAFRGELTAQWRAENPELISGENSAEALLAKIKAERAAQAPKKSTSRKKKATAGT